MNFLEKLREESKKDPKIIVFPEGKDPKILEAAYRLKKEGLVKQSIVVGLKEEIESAAKVCKADLSILEVVEPAKDPKFNEYVEEYFELRKHKNISKDFAIEQMKRTNYFGAMSVRMGRADGMVAGINSETKPFIPAFEIVKTAKGISRASSLFFEVFPDKVLFYSDCGMNINPDEDTLAEIAITTAITAKQFWHDPGVAMLSFSTRGSAKDPLVDKVRNATEKARLKAQEMGLDIAIDGEIQFDAAFIPEVTRKKAPDSPFVNKPANVFIFPDLNAGNICYKVTERLAGAMAFGPIFQGLNKPVNDLSRGASVEDIVNVALITGIQGKK
ncbi:MAG TPA: phosphate acetyltransferase [Spirochaetota bacterium]|nr:phosphate acetyltransferase [Spirochaetota bacterium]